MLHEQGGVASIAFAPDKKTVALGGAHYIVLIDLAGEKPESKLPMDVGTGSLSFSQSGKLLAAATGHGVGVLWDLSAEAPKKTTFPKKVFSVSFGPDGKTLATGCDNNQVRLWDVSGADPKELAVSPNSPFAGNIVRKVLFSPDGKVVAANHYNMASEDDRVELWAVKENSLEARPMPKDVDNHAIPQAFNSQGTTLLMGPPQNGAAPFRFLDVSSPQARVTKTLWWHRHGAAACFAPDEKSLASIGDDGFVKLWDIAGKEKMIDRKTGTSPECGRWRFRPMARRSLPAAGIGRYACGTCPDRSPRKAQVIKGLQGPVSYLRFGPDDKSLVIGHHHDF